MKKMTMMMTMMGIPWRKRGSTFNNSRGDLKKNNNRCNNSNSINKSNNNSNTFIINSSKARKMEVLPEGYPEEKEAEPIKRMNSKSKKRKKKKDYLKEE